MIQVERALNLAGLPFEHRHIDFLRIRQLNRVGQLPVLGIRDELVADSTHILQRIEQLAPGSMSGGATAADLGLFAHLHSMPLPSTPWCAQEIAQRARLSSWLDRVDQATRPAAPTARLAGARHSA